MTLKFLIVDFDFINGIFWGGVFNPQDEILLQIIIIDKILNTPPTTTFAVILSPKTKWAVYSAIKGTEKINTLVWIGPNRGVAYIYILMFQMTLLQLKPEKN